MASLNLYLDSKNHFLPQVILPEAALRRERAASMKLAYSVGMKEIYFARFEKAYRSVNINPHVKLVCLETEIQSNRNRFPGDKDILSYIKELQEANPDDTPTIMRVMIHFYKSPFTRLTHPIERTWLSLLLDKRIAYKPLVDAEIPFQTNNESILV